MEIYIINNKNKLAQFMEQINQLKGYPKHINATGKNKAGGGIHKNITINNYCAMFENAKGNKYGIEVCDASSEVIPNSNENIKTEELQVEEVKQQQWFKIDEL